ncbi:MobP2 family relaxase [Romboutsia sp. MSSM.1001216sp_RTP31141st1_G3_RTP31141_220114]|uniref:MobP2 family relaxase n=1 Tax=unclassified Romboutsia TaxID=2626894 RepID=UPI0031B63FA4
MPAIVFKSRFVVSSSSKFNSYIDYINRDEAVRNDAFNRYSLYNDYMGNPQKTTGIFTSSSSNLTEKEKETLKENFAKAQRNKSVIWQDVYSFDNKWLRKQGLYDPLTKTLDEERIKEAIRKSIDYSLDKTNIKDSAIWSGSIHYNTDNIHIHVAICEPNPTRQRGKRTQKTLDNMKSKFINHLLDYDKEYKEINTLLRENLAYSNKKSLLMKDIEMKKILNEVVKNLPSDKRHWHYNYNTMNNARVHLDRLTDYYIMNYKSKEYKELIDKLNKQEKEWKEIYGKGQEGKQLDKFKEYRENKIKELYTRMGNKTLNEIKEIYMDNKNTSQRINNKNNNSLSKNNKFIKKNSITKRDINKISKALGDELDNIKNQNMYEKLQREIEMGR